ncbi:hypothetical protein AA0473_1198 [Acetobacter orleanensis NRIC 0473]|nr:hypothetical protein AA0473_1198 [Acetobacter orleanensis NRIC 0473]
MAARWACVAARADCACLTDRSASASALVVPVRGEDDVARELEEGCLLPEVPDAR